MESKYRIRNGQEVSCKATAFFMEEGIQEGWADILAEGIEDQFKALRNPNKRISWDQFLVFSQNLSRVYTNEELTEAGNRFMTSKFARPVTWMAQWFFMPADLMRWMAKPGKGAQMLVNCIESRLTEISDNVFELEVLMADGYYPSREYFLISKGGIGGVSQILGLPRARVEMEWITNGAKYTVYLPTGGARFSNFFSFFRSNARIKEVTAELREANTILDARNKALEEEIQERKRVLAAYRESEEKFRILTDQSMMGVMMMQDGLVKYINHAVEELSGYSIEEVLNFEPFGFLNLIHEEDRDFVAIQAKKKLAGEPDAVPAYSFRILRKDGGITWVQYISRVIMMGGRPAIIGTMADVTGMKSTERALRNSEAKSRALLEAIPDLMLVLDREGKILDFKDSTNTGFYVPPKSLGKRNISEYLPADFVSKIDDSIGKTLESASLEMFTHRFETHYGHQHYEIRLAPFQKESVLLIIRNITEAKKWEEELIRRNFELDSFVYRASHDLKSPLNSLMGLIDLVRHAGKDEPLDQYLDLMDRSVNKLDSFIRDLADFSRSERMELKLIPVDFKAIVHDALENLSHMENADRMTIKQEFRCDRKINSDPLRLQVIINNLISNAFKYQDLQKEEPFVSIKVICVEHGVDVTIEDNGIGIAEEYQDKVFNMFFRASVQSFGTGLGLYIVKHAVDRLKGSIKMESLEGEGTTWKVFLPYLEPGEAETTDIGKDLQTEAE